MQYAFLANYLVYMRHDKCEHWHDTLLLHSCKHSYWLHKQHIVYDTAANYESIHKYEIDTI